MNGMLGAGGGMHGQEPAQGQSDTGGTCAYFRGLIGLDVIGRLDSRETRVLDDHLARCSACSEDAADLAGLPIALEMAGAGEIPSGTAAPESLREAVLGRLGADASSLRHKRHVRGFALGIAAIVVLAGATVLSLPALSPSSGPAAAGSRTVVLHGASGVHATAVLEPRAWGTQVHLAESGQPGGQVFWVYMSTAEGQQWDGGTYRSVAGSTVHVDFPCAAAPGQVTRIWVQDATDRTVLWGSPV